MALGRIRERQGRFPEALAVLAQAEQASRAAGTKADLEQALRWQAWVHFRQDRYVEAIDLCHRALAALPGKPEPMPAGDSAPDPEHDPELAAIYNVLATCYANAGDPGQGQQYYLRALQLFRSLGNREREAVLLHNMATTYLPQGLLQETIETEQMSLSILEGLNSYRVCFPLITLGQTHLLRGEFDAARSVLERLLHLADAYQDAPRRGYALYLLGHLHLEQGDRIAARRCYQEAWMIAEQIQERFLCFELHQGLARLALDDGDGREARRQGQAALQRARPPVDAQLEGQALTTLGLVLGASGDTQQAEAHFCQALRLVETSGSRLDQAILHLYLADLCRREGRDEEACRHLGQALALSSTQGYDFLFTRRETRRSVPLLVLALGQALEVSEAGRLLAQIGQEAVEPLLALLSSAPDDCVRECVVHLLGEIGGDAGHPGTECAPAGSPSQRSRRGGPGPHRRRAATAAAYPGPGRLPGVARQPTHRPGSLAVPRDELLEALWPGLSPDSAALALNTTFSDLRRILEPYLGKGQPSRYLLRDEETLALNPAAETWYDVAAFEQAVRAGGQAARQALELYRSDFLPEEPYVDWVLRERERLRGLYLNTLMAWLEEQVQAGAWREGVELARRILDLEPWLEEVWRALMTCLARLGRRSEALQAYQACARALRDELDAAPSAETQILYEELKT